ncbi:MAG TPA: multidrug effflux MFS transporter [Gammaproteobacteria bacterium]|jgi:Bcr/CflA subfamily drug resistance transporter|nr:multidrug effflux MFS transporter [Gammaproteobacteria bacterium]
MQPTIPYKFFAIILLFASLAHISADIYVPSMPAIAKALHTDPASVQFTFFAFMFGFSIAHLFYGPLSDRIGRRKPILTGIGLSIIGTLCCIFAPSIYLLIVGRFIQGIGVAVCNSVGRSITRDLLSGSHLAKMGSYLGMILVLVTATAPTLGGYIQYYFDWRAVFVFLLIYSSLIWLLTWKILPETNTQLNPHATKLNVILHNYRILITNKTFIGYTLCASCAYAGIIAYATSAPFLLQTVIGLTPIEFGWLSFVFSGAIFISFLINSQLILKQGIPTMVLVGNCLMTLSGLIMLLLASMGWVNAFAIVLPVALFCMGAGFNFGNATAGAFHPFPHIAGSAGALFGCLQIFGGALASGIVAALQITNQMPLAGILILLGIIALISWKFLASVDSAIDANTQ